MMDKRFILTIVVAFFVLSGCNQTVTTEGNLVDNKNIPERQNSVVEHVAEPTIPVRVEEKIILKVDVGGSDYEADYPGRKKPILLPNSSLRRSIRT
jgi:hypothetical protein